MACLALLAGGGAERAGRFSRRLQTIGSKLSLRSRSALACVSVKPSGCGGGRTSTLTAACCRCSRRWSGLASSRGSASRRPRGAVARSTCRAGSPRPCAGIGRASSRNGSRPAPGGASRGLVFTTTIGTAIDKSRLHKDFKTVLRAAGLPDIRDHDLQHTAATLLLAQGRRPADHHGDARALADQPDDEHLRARHAGAAARGGGEDGRDPHSLSPQRS